MKKVFSNEAQTDIEKRTREEQERLSAVSTAVEVAKRDLEVLEKAKSALEVGVMNASQLETEAKKRYLDIQGDIEIALIELDKARQEKREAQKEVAVAKDRHKSVLGEIEALLGDRSKVCLEIDSLIVKRGSLNVELKRIEDEIALALVQEKAGKELMLERNKEIVSRNDELSLVLRDIEGANKRLGQLFAQKVEFDRIVEEARVRKNAELDAMDLAIKESEEVRTKLLHEKAQLDHVIEKRNRAEKETLDFVASKERLMAVIAEQTEFLKKLKQDNEIKNELGL